MQLACVFTWCQRELCRIWGQSSLKQLEAMPVVEVVVL